MWPWTEEAALQNILKGVQESAKSDFSEIRYFGQLPILAQLRNSDIKFMEAMETIIPVISFQEFLLVNNRFF